MIISVPILMLDEVINGRIYPSSEIKKAVKAYMTLKNRDRFGELYIGSKGKGIQKSDVFLISHKIHEIWIDNGYPRYLFAKLEILNTDKGKILKDLVTKVRKGSYEFTPKMNGIIIGDVINNITLITIDAYYNPSNMPIDTNPSMHIEFIKADEMNI